MSFNNVAKGMANEYGIRKPSTKTLYNWVREYGHKAFEIANRTPVNVGDEWVADEMMVDVEGGKAWNWNIMDAKTRYLLASHLTKGHSTADAMQAID